MPKDIIYKGNSIISVKTIPDYPHPVVIKRPAKLHSSQRNIPSLEKEYEMTSSLDDVEGVRKAYKLQSLENQPSLVLEYVEGKTLKDHIAEKTLDLRSRLEIALGLTRVLAKIHERNIIHLDINSKNILIGDKPQAVHIIDLGSASRIDRSGQQKVRPDQMLGTLLYISPEQTGRINRTVDERSDLYSLGVVLYELMTQQLPFDSKDPLELVHSHIAKEPVFPSEESAEIPEVISAIILKLLRKDAEDRYQSAAGIQADLGKCLQRLSPEGRIDDFTLGEADYSRRLRFPQKLYGRDNELKELVSTFESICRESSGIVFVSGYSGIGKTALIEEIQRPVSEKNGYFLRGKFDQFSTSPYAGITQALAQFVSQILTQPETQLAAWRSRILEAVGPNGGILLDVIPSLELVIGPQPTVPDLSGQEAQNRFNYVFQRFFSAIARSEHPVCFFLDDLQWVDPGSLGLLKNLFSSPDFAHLLVVGAYRDNEVHDDHPLMTLIADLEKAGANLKRMTLPKLAESDIEALISDTLRRDPGKTQEFSRLIYAQTNGNPFFTRQVLRSMEDHGLLALDSASCRWRWDMDAFRDHDVAASVVELLVGKLKGLPVDIQETLKVAACIGGQFDIATLTVVIERDDDEILDHVQKAAEAGLIWERDDRGFFVHDRVQEAAYTLVPIEERDRLHLTIGRLLLQRHHASDDKQDPYRIVDQLNHGLHLVEDEQERMQIARLNLQAARAARQASAFETGLNYAQAGIEFLGENSWDQDYQLTLALEEQAALMAHAAGDIPTMKQHSEQVLQRGRDPLDLSRVQRLHIEFLLSSKLFDEAIEYGLGALQNLGHELALNPDMEFVIAKLSELLERLEREPPDYLSMPRLEDQDKELLAVSEILFPVGNAAFISRPALAPLTYIHIIELALERRLLPEHTPGMIAVVGMFANAFLGKVEVAHAYGKTAIELASRPAFHTSICVPLQVHGLYNHFWRKPLRETLDLFDRGIQSAHDCGDNEFVAYMSHSWSKHAFYASIELARVEERCLRLRTFVDGIQYVTQSRWINIYVTAVQALRGSSSAQGITWRGTPFDDDRDLPDLQRVEDQLGLLYVYCAKAWVATLLGNHEGVEEYSDLSCSFLMAAPTGLEKAMLTFICGLRHARELRVTPESSESEQALQEQLDLLERFAGLAPMNFAHKLSLVQAEVHRARGEILPAMKAYEQAGQGARENDYLNEAGLAHALAAEFYQDLGLHQSALHNVEQAAQVWQSWGAHALVESLSQRFPDLLGQSDLLKESSRSDDRARATATLSTTPHHVDLESITSASRLLAAETDLEQLGRKMMTLVMANSGADKAFVLLRRETEWFAHALGYSTKEKPYVLLNRPFDPAGRDIDLIPEPILNYCLRSKEILVVGNAQLDSRFVEDSTIQTQKIKSIACVPVLSRGEIRALLYLENRQMSDVFTLENVGILKHLASQFGISVENALLYADLNLKVQELQESERKYRQLVEDINDVIYSVDSQGRVSPAIKSLIGYEPHELIGKHFAGFVHSEDIETMKKGFESALAGKIIPTDYRIINKAGSYIWGRALSKVVKDDNNNILGIRGVISDITDRKKAEEEARIQREILARMSRATRMGQLAGSIAHELNQPLTGILSNAQAAEMMLESGQWEADEMAEIMTEIIEDTKRSGEVIRNLRELYHEQRSEFVPFALNTVIDKTIQLLHSEAILQDVVLKTECASSLPLVSGIQIQLQQVFVNLVMNGMQAMSGTEKGNRRILIATALDAMEVKAWVEDNGPGIDADKIDRIFEPLVTWKPGGTGMGLAINNTIIEAHGGRMWAENRREGGARVGFSLPVLKGENQA